MSARLAAALMLVAGEAGAEVPRLDAEAFCAQRQDVLAALTSTPMPDTLTDCLRWESEALARLAPIWDEVPVEVQADCLASLHSTPMAGLGPAAYVGLELCLDDRLDHH